MSSQVFAEKMYLPVLCYRARILLECSFCLMRSVSTSHSVTDGAIISLHRAHLKQVIPGDIYRLKLPRDLITGEATDACLTADPGVASSIPARSHTFVEINHEIISTVILLPSADSLKKDCCQLQAKVCARITG